MEVAEKKKYLAPLQSSQTAIVAILEEVNEDLFTYKSTPENWSIAEVIEHLILIENTVIGTLKQLGSTKPQATLDQPLATEKVLELSASRTLKSKAPDAFVPKGIYQQKTVAVNAFKQSRERVAHFINTTPLNLETIVFPHPRIGVLTGYNWLTFLAGHSLKHLAQIEEIKAQH